MRIISQSGHVIQIEVMGERPINTTTTRHGEGQIILKKLETAARNDRNKSSIGMISDASKICWKLNTHLASRLLAPLLNIEYLTSRTRARQAYL